MIQFNPDNGTHSYLRLLAQIHARQEYKLNPQQWLMDHGHDFTYAALPKGVRRGPMKHCFWNAYETAKRGKGRFVYCEGMAVGYLLPVEHAWCIDRETGLVVDLTWLQGADYVGVPVRLKYVLRCLDIEQPVVMNWLEDYPIISGAVPVEQWREEIR